MKYISLFAGIGGADLGLDRAGHECVAQVEIDPYCQSVLRKHWPTVPKFSDVKTVGRHNLPDADLIVGGFPCQDISNAGVQRGIVEGNRSGLWYEFYRIICEIRPRYVIVENVDAILNRGIDIVLGSLAQIGYDAEWECLPASAFAAPHKRERFFLVAYANRSGRQELGEVVQSQDFQSPDSTSDLADESGSAGTLLPTGGFLGQTSEGFNRFRQNVGLSQWRFEPALDRMAHGVPNNVDERRSSWIGEKFDPLILWEEREPLYEKQISALGNAIVPQVMEYIGLAISQFDAQRNVA